MRPLIVMLLTLEACKVDLAAVGQAPAPTGQVPAALPPPAPGPNGEKVYQILYAGEIGLPARAAGQRARMLAWMDAVGFTSDQLRSLLGLAAQVRATEARDEEILAQIGEAEGRALTPVYQDLVARYANGAKVSDGDLEPFSARLDAARLQAYAGSDPRAAHYRSVRTALDQVGKWAATATSEQRARLGECRFFLQRKLGPFTNPGDYEKWLGTAWNGADFASLRAAGRPVDEGQMDIGGLWTDDGAIEPSNPGIRIAVLLLFAIEEEGFVEAVEVRLGTRAPEDYSSGGALAGP